LFPEKNMSKKVRILQVCRLTHLWGMDLFREISRAFADDKYEITTVFLSNKPGHELYKGYDGYHGNLLFWGIDRRRFNFRFIAIRKLIRLFRENDFDVVISHHYRPMLLVELANRFCGIPKLYSVNHDIGNLRHRGRRIFVRKFLSNRWKFIAVSDAVKRDLLSANAGLGEDRLITIYNTSDAEALSEQQFAREQARKKLDIPKDCFVFGNIARLVPRKGHQFLVRAFAEIGREQRHCCLVIIGLGHLETQLIRLAEKEEVADQIIIATSVATDAIKYVRAFDVFVLSSLKEPFGIVLLEAMAARLPLIATAVDGIPEVVGEAGMLVPPGDVPALTQALRKVLRLTDEDRAQLGFRSYSRFHERFSIQKYHGAFQHLAET
jgi:glycosyltransferase involved in cell wall biosynthesis